MNKPNYYSVPDLARETGESEAAWRKRVWLKQIPYVKCGSNVRIKREDFEAWLEARRVPAGGAK